MHESVYRFAFDRYSFNQVLFFNTIPMKRFMQMLLASFGVLALMLAGCNSAPATPAATDSDAKPSAAVEQPAAPDNNSVGIGVEVTPSEDAASTDK